MPMIYKLDVLSALKEAGYNTNRIRKEKLIGEAMLQKIRSGQMPSWATLETICSLLDVQPGRSRKIRGLSAKRCSRFP